MNKLLVVSHRPFDQEGGSTARWRSFIRLLPALGWHVDTVTAPVRSGGVEFAKGPKERRRAQARARIMSWVGRVATPLSSALGIRPEALPPSTLWALRGSMETRKRLREGKYDVVLATAPPIAALLAARLACGKATPPLILELRDLWAGNPAFDRRGGLLGAVESWAFQRAHAVIGCTPEAVADLKRRHPQFADRIVEVLNGFEPELLGLRKPPSPPGKRVTILHSGTLSVDRPIERLLKVLACEPYCSSFRLVLHGYLVPAIQREVEKFAGDCEIEVLPPSGWDDAIRRMADADATLISQSRGAGDATAVASKVYEYLALGKPVVCLSHGGATEALLTRLDVDRYCGRLDDAGSIAAALDHLREEPQPAPVPEERLAPYDRSKLVKRMVDVLNATLNESKAQA